MLKKKAVEAFVESKGLGVGGGQFSTYIKNQRAGGQFPAQLTANEPHSTYFGLLAETGILGVLAIIMVFVTVIRFVKAQPLGILQQAALLYCGLIAVDAFVMDVLNFRMLWVAMGLLSIDGYE